MHRIGIDVGGTFTDVVLMDDVSGRVWATKVPTTPADPSQGSANGIHTILKISGLAKDAIDFIGHGTTIATNMVIEGKGARTVLLTTKGFRDILEIRRVSRHDRADLYDLFFANPPQLVPRHLRREIGERILFDGSVETPLDREELEREILALGEEGVEAVAICFLNSHVNSEHEAIALGEVKRRQQALFTTASFEINPEMMEYERTCTTVMNAMLGPRCGRYIQAFERQTREAGLGADIAFMQSNGGLAKPSIAAERPATLLGSGPAGGVTAAVRVCDRIGRGNAITGDMGGTSFDVALIRDFKAETRNQTELNSYTVRCPNLDIISIGAGGGSIAWIDEGGGVRIGPESAAADPGPACYGRGGTRPTVTDCNLVLGYIDADRFLGGDFRLDVAAAERAIDEAIAKPLGVSVTEAALTVRAVANALMAQAIRLVTVERGYDPRDFFYLPYGGAGPVHSIDLARELEIPTVLVPPLPGLFSAFGMLVSDLLHDLQAPVAANLDEIAAADLERRFAELEDRARALDKDAEVDLSAVTMRRSCDCAYLGQAETLKIEVEGGAIDAAALSRIGADFEDEHRRHWNFLQQDRPIRLVNIRVQAVGKIGSFGSGDAALNARTDEADTIGQRRIHLEGEWRDVPRYARAALAPGAVVTGPAVIEEPSTNLVIGTGDRLTVDPLQNIVVELRRAS